MSATPENTAGKITESVMIAVRSEIDRENLPTSSYNKIYSKVYNILCEHGIDKLKEDKK